MQFLLSDVVIKIAKEVLGVTVNVAPGERLTKEYLANLNNAVNAVQNPVVYLGIDPGESNGICGYDAKYYLLFMLTIHHEDMVMFMHQFKSVKKCIMEEYKVFSHKAKQHINSDLKTTQVIGRVQSWAKLHEVELIMQPSSIKPTGYKWIRKKPLPKSNPMNHSLDGHVHFVYWGVRTGRIKLEDILRNEVMRA